MCIYLECMYIEEIGCSLKEDASRGLLTAGNGSGTLMLRLRVLATSLCTLSGLVGGSRLAWLQTGPWTALKLWTRRLVSLGKWRLLLSQCWGLPISSSTIYMCNIHIHVKITYNYWMPLLFSLSHVRDQYLPVVLWSLRCSAPIISRFIDVLFQWHFTDNSTQLLTMEVDWNETCLFTLMLSKLTPLAWAFFSCWSIPVAFVLLTDFVFSTKT